MNKEFQLKARQHTKSCRVCNHCDGVACAGEIPGVGGKGTGSTFKRNYEYLRKVHPLMDPLKPDQKISTKSDFFGHPIAMPIFGAPIAGMQPQYQSDVSERDYAFAMIKGALDAGTISFTGDGKDLNLFLEPLEIIKQHDYKGVVTIKPWEQKGLDLRLSKVDTSKLWALASDVDAAGLLFLRGADPKITNFSVEDIKYLKSQIRCPLIIKGILTPKAALKALEGGADGIVVSNHGGRVLDDTISTIEALPDIVKAVNSRAKIFIDGGFRSGNDIFKALALGADGVLIGRPLALEAISEGSTGVTDYFLQLQQELKETMLMCGVNNLSEITKDKVMIEFEK